MYRTSLILKRVLLFASSSKLKRIEKAPQAVQESFEDFGFFTISLLEARRQERDAPPFFYDRHISDWIQCFIRKMSTLWPGPMRTSQRNGGLLLGRACVIFHFFNLLIALLWRCQTRKTQWKQGSGNDSKQSLVIQGMQSRFSRMICRDISQHRGIRS